MTTTTSYGTWLKFTGQLSVRAGIEAAMEGHAEGHDTVAIEAGYRSAINSMLFDSGIRLIGDEFYGPAEDCAGCREVAPGYISEVLDAINFWAIVMRHRIKI